MDQDAVKVLDSAEAVVGVWMKYEEVAMHFNDLMMRWRLQAIGGLATLVTLAGFVVGGADNELVRYRAMLIFGSLLFCVWIGVAVIDLFYYRRLLKGAVAALLHIESKTTDLKLSTSIEEAAKYPGMWGPYVFYLSGLVPLIGIIWWAVTNLRSLTG